MEGGAGLSTRITRPGTFYLLNLQSGKRSLVGHGTGTHAHVHYTHTLYTHTTYLYTLYTPIHTTLHTHYSLHPPTSRG